MECGLVARKLYTGTGSEALTDADACGPFLSPRLPFCTSLLYPSRSLSPSLCVLQCGLALMHVRLGFVSAVRPWKSLGGGTQASFTLLT